MDTFALWAHRRTGAVYAVRIRGARVTGVCGPLADASSAFAHDLSCYDYEDGTGAAAIEEQRHEFTLAANWLATNW